MSCTLHCCRRRNTARQFFDRKGHAACARCRPTRGAKNQAHQRGGLAAAALPTRQSERSDAARDLVAELALADGIVLGSPGYHGSISGLVKNALDYAEDLRLDARPYLSGRAIGCIATAGGWPGAVNTLGALARNRACAARLAHAAGRRDQFNGDDFRRGRHMSGSACCTNARFNRRRNHELRTAGKGEVKL
jgi:multimeric flavodoxin WrbA